MPKPPNLVLDTPTEDWIKAFNAARGWRSLRGQHAPTPDADNLRVTPKTQLKDEREHALGGWRRTELTRLIQKQEAELAQLDIDLAALPQGVDPAAIKAQRDELATHVAVNRADLAIVNRVDERVAQLRAVEGHLPQDLTDVRNECRRLDALAAQANFDPRALDQTLLAEFRTQHVMVQANIEKARAEVMTLTTEDGTRTRSYAIVNDKEYKILFGLLDQAISIVETGDLQGAITRVGEAQAKLNEFRNARTGAKVHAAPASQYGDLEGPMAHVADLIATLQTRGFAAAADQFAQRNDALSASIRQAVATNAPDLRATFLPQVETLERELAAARDTMLRTEEIVADIRTDITSMRANGHQVRPDKSDRELQALIALLNVRAVMATALADAEMAARLTRERLERTKVEDLRRANLKPSDLSASLQALDGRFDALFKHDRKGNVKEITDTQSGDKKGDKKNRDLPRGALEEIELQLLAAKQLIASDSVDALKTADSYLAGAKNFLDAITNDPKVYVHLGEGFDKVEKSLAIIAKHYPLYEQGRQLDLKAELAAMRTDHITRPQDMVRSDTADLAARVATLEVEIKALQVTKRTLVKQADRIDEIIKDIGNRLKKDQTGFVQFNGYYGPEVARMETLRGKIAERSPASLSDAAAGLININGNLGWLLTLLERSKNGGVLDNFEAEQVAGLVTAARSGQLEHDANEAQKSAFNNGIDALTAQISGAEGIAGLKDFITRKQSTKDLLKDIKADLNELTALEGECKGLKAETQKAGSYIDGLAKLEGLKSRAIQMRDDVKGAKAILDTDLATAATNCVAAINLFVASLGTFVEDVVEPAGIDGGGNQLDQPPVNRAVIETFFTRLAGTFAKVDLDAMRAQSVRVADSSLSTDDRKIARKVALQELRKLIALFDGFAPMQHFRSHPFAKGDALTRLVSARQALPRLEKRLLTAIA